MEVIFKLAFEQLRQSTKANEQTCREVAARIADEVTRICQESRRIQASGEIEDWAKTLANHRLKLCLRYYKLGSNPGRVELQSTLSAIVYRYISPSRERTSYKARAILIEDFIQGFYAEALNAFRRETELSKTYTPRFRLELAEYMAFCERYAKRRIPLPGRRAQQLIILRAQTFSQKQPPETSVDIDMAAEGSSSDSQGEHRSSAFHELRALMGEQEGLLPDVSMREKVIDELKTYLKERQQQECVDYFTLRLQDLSTNEIEAILGITPRQRDYLQQRFKYHLIRFALSHRWELVHQWLEADLDRNLGLTPQEWQSFTHQLNPQQKKILAFKQQKVANSEIAQKLSLSITQAEKQWFKLLELAWDIRNRSVS
ncbi:heterocyst differentiation protein HetZ [Lusitaniella coriacea LEGE 07157]|uniref:Heterocyst differentiation protein HetZ n=1 Tax=Lusitaniella coriacea LEGE 07157 TaxID=945747 RepID=A0A8J7J9U4_9CYAN|nr:heterocyst differentiation protein HetZ [Lusitaniella coriacea]MBE9115830.1 heterocyst differentiation protein HetZ [Lusitaniella coriacea LEGE 07157]